MKVLLYLFISATLSDVVHYHFHEGPELDSNLYESVRNL